MTAMSEKSMNAGTVVPMLIGLLLSAAADAPGPGAAHQGVEMTEVFSRVERNHPPFFSEEEWAAFPATRAYTFGYSDVHRPRVPLVSGRALTGTTYGFSAFPVARHEWDARILAGQGVNILRSSPRSVDAEGDDPADLHLWLEKAARWKAQGIGVFVDFTGIHGMAQVMRSVYGDKPPPAMQTFLRHATAGHVMDKVGDYFNPEYVEAALRITLDFCRAFVPAGNVIALHPHDEPELAHAGPFTEAARRNFQEWTRQLFDDTTPGLDSNGDGATFNETYGGDCTVWDEADLRPPETLSADQKGRRERLENIWRKLGFVRFLNRLAEGVKAEFPDLFWVHSYLDRDRISVPASQPGIDMLAVGNYSSYARSARYATVVVFDAVSAGAGLTLDGASNREAWQKDLAPAREEPPSGGKVLNTDFKGLDAWRTWTVEHRGDPLVSHRQGKGLTTPAKGQLDFTMKVDPREYAAPGAGNGRQTLPEIPSGFDRQPGGWRGRIQHQPALHCRAGRPRAGTASHL
jgi:hypothetical protein